MRKVVKASTEAKYIKAKRLEDAIIPGKSLYWAFGDMPYNDSVCDWLSTSMITADKTVDIEPFSERDVVIINIAPDNEERNGNLAIVIEKAEPREGGGYEYVGVPISTANTMPNGSYTDYDGSTVVKDFNRFIPGTIMRPSRDVYLQYGNIIKFNSDGFSETGVRKGKLDNKLFDYLKQLVNEEVAYAPQFYGE